MASSLNEDYEKIVQDIVESAVTAIDRGWGFDWLTQICDGNGTALQLSLNRDASDFKGWHFEYAHWERRSPELTAYIDIDVNDVNLRPKRRRLYE